MTTAILLDQRDAEAFREQRPAAARVIALTPAAHVPVAGLNLSILSSDSLFGNFGHWRAVVLGDRAYRAMMAMLETRLPLSLGARLLLEHRVNSLAMIAWRAWSSVGSEGPWLLCRDGAWHSAADRGEAQMHVVRWVIGDGWRYSRRPVQPPLPGLYRLLRRAALSVMARRGRWFAGPGSYRMGLGRLLAAAQPPLGEAVMAFGGNARTAYGTLVKGFLRSFRPGYKAVTVVLAPRWQDVPSLQHYDDAFRAAVAAVTDAPIRRVLEHVGPALADSNRVIAALALDCADAFSALRPEYCIYQNSESIQTAPVADAAGATGVTRVTLNNNTLSTGHSRVGMMVSERMARVRYASPLWDVMLCWSPHGAAIARAADPDLAGRILPVRVPPGPARKPGGGAPFRVLQADNYHEWLFSQPVLVETSDEYAAHVGPLIATLGRMPGIELEIRLKSKGECNPGVMAALFDLPASVSVTDISVPFAKRVAESDLVVSYMSTTVEEALQMRVPLLLWGPVARYRHLQARMTPPTQQDRAAVYAVADAGDLASMIAAIRDAHAGRPLTDAELAGHVWPDEIPDLAAIAGLIAEGRLTASSSSHFPPAKSS